MPITQLYMHFSNYSASQNTILQFSYHSQFNNMDVITVFTNFQDKLEMLIFPEIIYQCLVNNLVYDTGTPHYASDLLR